LELWRKLSIALKDMFHGRMNCAVLHSALIASFNSFRYEVTDADCTVVVSQRQPPIGGCGAAHVTMLDELNSLR
jgi:hypothetical protein